MISLEQLSVGRDRPSDQPGWLGFFRVVGRPTAAELAAKRHLVGAAVASHRAATINYL